MRPASGEMLNEIDRGCCTSVFGVRRERVVAWERDQKELQRLWEGTMVAFIGLISGDSYSDMVYRDLRLATPFFRYP